MDDELAERIRETAEVAALENAVKHGEDAQVGAIMGPMMGENPEFRQHGDEIPGLIAPVIGRVNDLSPAERRERLGELAPDRLAELEADPEETHPLPDLPDVDPDDVEPGAIRLRLAPNPNGPWHLGNARMPAVIGTYKRRYDGWMCCRFDDTDPDTKRPDLDAYDEILASIEYLGFEPDAVLRASDRLETYYEHARELIEVGGAYACSCPQAAFSDMKNSGEACPHRDRSAAETLDMFEGMIDGEYGEGEMVLRVRTDIEHPNPALRDWVAFRQIDRPHPRDAAAAYRCWPMLDFQSGIDDHLTEITHIVRGIDLQDSAKRQQFVYDYFDWTYPEVVHWGRIEVDEYDVPLSTSSISELIASGELDGWDDPRAPTLASLRRRGIRGPAIVEAMVELGISTSNADLAMSAVYSANRERVDDEATRRFLVRDGLAVPLAAGEDTPDGRVPDVATPPRHPEHPDRGDREIPVGDRVLVEPADYPDEEGERVWLKGLGCLRRVDDAFVYAGDDLSAVREEDVPVVHWAPADAARPVTLRTMAGDVSGMAEPGVLDDAVDDVVQFERVGFARIDEHGDEASVAYFAHK